MNSEPKFFLDHISNISSEPNSSAYFELTRVLPPYIRSLQYLTISKPTSYTLQTLSKYAEFFGSYITLQYLIKNLNTS